MSEITMVGESDDYYFVQYDGDYVFLQRKAQETTGDEPLSSEESVICGLCKMLLHEEKE
jgi:hypothetical protein